MDDGPETGTRPRLIGPLRALGLRFSVRSTDAALGCTLDRLLASLADPAGGPVATAYTLVERGPGGAGGFAVSAGDEPVGETATAHGAVSLLLWDVNRRAVASTPDHLLLHAAAVAYQGHGILLPGASGTGKTTLAAGLVLSGMAYLTDEVAALDPVGYELVPYPKPLSVERASWASLAELGVVDDRRGVDEETPWHLEPSRLRAGAVGHRCQPRFVVRHRFVPGPATSLTPLPRTEALVALAESSFQPLHRRPLGFETLAAVVRRCECLQLTVGHLGEACTVLLGSVERILSGAGR